MRVYLVFFQILLFNFCLSQPIYQKLYGVGQSGISLGSFESFNDGAKLIASRIDDDILLFKIDSGGNQIWSKTYGDTSYTEVVTKTLKTFNNNIIVTGFRNQSNLMTSNIIMMRFDSLGNNLWSLSFGDTLGDLALDIVELADSSFIITGGYNAYSMNFDKSQTFVSRVSSSGIIVWTKTYGQICDSCQTEIGRICITNDNNFLLYGKSSLYGDAFQGHKMISKIDLLGNVLWTKYYYDLCESSGIDKLIRTSDNNYLVLGTTCNSNLTGDLDILLMKIDSMGEILWSNKYAGFTGSSDKASDVIETLDSNYLFSGSSSLTKANSSGTLLWSSSYLLSPFSNISYKVEEWGNTFFVLGSLIYNGFNNLYVYRSDTSGKACINTFITYVTANVSISDSNVVLDHFVVFPIITSTSYTGNNITLQDSLFCQSVVSLSEYTSDDFNLILFPNPASDKILLDLKRNSIKNDSQVFITDMYGRILKILKFVPDKKIIEIDISDLSSGCYILQLNRPDNINLTSKFIKY